MLIPPPLIPTKYKCIEKVIDSYIATMQKHSAAIMLNKLDFDEYAAEVGLMKLLTVKGVPVVIYYGMTKGYILAL